MSHFSQMGWKSKSERRGGFCESIALQGVCSLPELMSMCKWEEDSTVTGPDMTEPMTPQQQPPISNLLQPLWSNFLPLQLKEFLIISHQYHLSLASILKPLTLIFSPLFLPKS